MDKQKEEKIPVTNDYIFKRIFTKEGNEDILKDLLIAILDKPIDKIEVQSEVTLEKEIIENKLGRLDIVALLNDDTIVNIELQVVNNRNIIDRTLYYWSGLHHNNLKRGKDYKETIKTISINILNYNEFEEGPYHEVARLKREYQNEVLTEKMEMHFIQIPKFIEEKRGTETKIEQWLQFISQENQGEVEKAMEKNEKVRKAFGQYKTLTGDEYEKRLAFLKERAIKDEISAINNGIAQGIEQGMVEKSKEIARKLLKLGMKIEEIMEITELPKEEIEKLK